MSETVSVDEFQALEQKVLQTVELIRKERELRSTAEAERDAAQAETAALREQMEQAAQSAQGELQAMRSERDVVRGRVERMLQQMDELLA